MVVTDYGPILAALFDFSVLLAILAGLYAIHLIRRL
jgi:hypothetical protein